MQKFLLLLILLSSPLQAAEGFKWIVPVPKPKAAPQEYVPPPPAIDLSEMLEPADALPDVTQYVYRIRAWSLGTQMSYNEACAVSLGGGKMVTVAHLLQGLHQPRAQVEIDGKWVNCSVTIVPGGSVEGIDVADVFVSTRPDLKGTTRREPKYMEEVLVYGLKTKTVLRGTITNRGPYSVNVSLPEYTKIGASSGDSGGGIFSLDGELLATLTGGNAVEPRVVQGIPTSIATQGLAAVPRPKPNTPLQAPASPQARPAAPYGYQWDCSNGNCQLRQVQPMAQPQMRYSTSVPAKPARTGFIARLFGGK